MHGLFIWERRRSEKMEFQSGEGKNKHGRNGEKGVIKGQSCKQAAGQHAYLARLRASSLQSISLNPTASYFLCEHTLYSVCAHFATVM